MADNTFKINQDREEKTSFFTIIENYLNVNPWLEEGLPLKFLPHVLYVCFLGIVYIGNNHYAERTIRNIDKLQVEVENLRADYTTLKADYMFDSKQSEVSKKVAGMGLKESLQPPYKIVVAK